MINHNAIRSACGPHAFEEYLAIVVVSEMPRLQYLTEDEVDKDWVHRGPKFVRGVVERIASDCFVNIDLIEELSRRIWTANAKIATQPIDRIAMNGVEFIWTKDVIVFSKCSPHFFEYMHQVHVTKEKDLNIAEVSELIDSSATEEEANVLYSAIWQLGHDLKAYIDTFSGDYATKPFGKTFVSTAYNLMINAARLNGDKILSRVQDVRSILGDGPAIVKSKFEITDDVVLSERLVASLESAAESDTDFTAGPLVFPSDKIKELASAARLNRDTNLYAAAKEKSDEVLGATKVRSLVDISVDSRHEMSALHIFYPTKAGIVSEIKAEAESTPYDAGDHPWLAAISTTIASASEEENALCKELVGFELKEVTTLERLHELVSHFNTDLTNNYKADTVTAIRKLVEGRDMSVSAALVEHSTRLEKANNHLEGLILAFNNINEALEERIAL